MTPISDEKYTPERRNRLYKTLSHYLKTDLEMILEDLRGMVSIWVNMANCVRETSPSQQAELYRELSEPHRIRSELAALRRKKVKA